MNVKAVGTYIAALIDGYDLKTQEVTVAAGVSPNYVWRLKRGAINSPSAEIISSLFRVVGGSADHLQRLLMDDATEDEARILAAQRIAAARTPVHEAGFSDEELRLLSRLSPEQRRRLPDILRRLMIPDEPV